MNKYIIDMIATGDDIYQDDLREYGFEYQTYIYTASEREALDWFHEHVAIKCLDDWEIIVTKEVVDPLRPGCFGTYKEKNAACLGTCDCRASCWGNTNMLTGTGESEIPESTIKTAPKCVDECGHTAECIQLKDKLPDIIVETKKACFGSVTKESTCQGTCQQALGCEAYTITGMCTTQAPVRKEAPKRDAEEDKAKLDYLPMDLLELVAAAYELGAKKDYPRNSWRDGFSISRTVAASRRHDKDFWDKGETFDKQALEKYGLKVYHSACIIFNQLCILDTLINHPELDDRRVILNQEEKTGEIKDE